MDYAGVETSPQQFSPTVDQNLDENQDGTKGCTDLHSDKTNIEIDSQHLIPGELLQNINLDYNLSEKIVHHEDRFTIPDELLPSFNAYRRESITIHPFSTSEKEQSDEHFNDKKSASVVQDHGQIVNKFMDWISEDLLKVHAKRKGNADHYKRGKSTIPMMHFGIETVEDKNWFYTMGFPDQSWTDSCLSYGHKVLANEFDPNALRTRYVALLWEYGTRKQDANAHSDVEAPLRPARQSRITSVTEVFDV
ncbi:hypothetical protein CQW23_06262 [Capsicum baccatum]|uniref:Uncharacterized protein n=1 Tax=Capsicum baccatum TaxID=33114 RepID=A0A2G2X2W5_CAPBA|nr:hypothetical protein CQW23_06262 [Capsicum baccatum]